MRGNGTSLAAVVSLLFLLCFATTDAAAATALKRCRAAKLRAAGVEASTRLACEQLALRTANTAACTSAAAALRDDAFARCDASGRCVATGDSATLGAAVDALVDSTLASLRPGGAAASHCTSIELGAAGRSVTKLVKAHVHDVRTPDAVRLAADVARARRHLEVAFARALAKRDCVSNTTAAQLAPLLEAAVTGFRGLLAERCGNGVVEGTEACDGAGCFAADPIEPAGCSAPGSGNECQCCATTSPCYMRGNGLVDPVEVPCCSGVCNIPGPGAGPNVTVYCTEPPPADACPCWTTASLDAAFPPGYFDQNGRGGIVCTSGSLPSFGAADICYWVTYPIARGVATIFSDDLCAMVSDLDPANTGVCGGVPTNIASITIEQKAACIAALEASQPYLGSCVGGTH